MKKTKLLETVQKERELLRNLKNNSLNFDKDRKLYSSVFISYQRFVNENNKEELDNCLRSVVSIVTYITKKYGFWMPSHADIMHDKLRMELYRIFCKQTNFFSFHAFWSYVIKACYNLWKKLRAQGKLEKEAILYYTDNKWYSNNLSAEEIIDFFNGNTKLWILESFNFIANSRFTDKKLRSTIKSMTNGYLNNTLQEPHHYNISVKAYRKLLQIMIVYLRILFKEAKKKFGHTMVDYYDDVLFYYKSNWLK